MAGTNREHVAIQRRIYHHLLTIEKDPSQLKHLINLIQTEMDEEDVAYVEKQIRKQFGE